MSTESQAVHEQQESTTFADRLKAEFSTTALVLIPIAVGINLAGGWVVNTLKLPVFLDMVGTILSAVLAGPLVGATVGLLTNVFMGLTVNPVYFPYALVSIVNGLIVGFMAARGLFKPWLGLIGTWVAITLASVATAAPITVYMFGGTTGATGGSAITAFLLATGRKLWTSVAGAAILENGLDRAISIAVAFIVLRAIPHSMVSQVTRASLEE
jgi:energy-coupling factor transport system substrate-specific component